MNETGEGGRGGPYLYPYRQAYGGTLPHDEMEPGAVICMTSPFFSHRGPGCGRVHWLTRTLREKPSHRPWSALHVACHGRR